MMRIIFILQIIIILTITAKSQNNIDSLLHLLEEVKTDTAKVKLLNKIASEYTRSDLVKSFQYSSTADSISNKIGYTNGKAESLRTQGIYYFRKSEYSNALTAVKQALTLFEQTKNLEGEANCLLNIGGIFKQTNNFDSALFYFQKSLDLRLTTKTIDKERIAATYNNIGIVYQSQGNFPMALEYHQKSLLIKEEIFDKAGTSASYNNLGVIYSRRNNYLKAIENYKKSLNISKEISDQLGITMNYNNIAIAHFKNNQTDSAIIYAKESIKISNEIHNKRGLAFSYNILGDIYLKNNDLHLAMDYYDKGLQIATETDNSSVKFGTLIGKGLIKIKQHDFQTAIIFGKQVYSWAVGCGEINMTKQSSKLLADAFNAIGKYKEAYEFQIIYMTMNDSIQNESNTEKIVGLEYEYKFQKEKLVQEKKQVEQQANLSKQKQIILVFIIGLSLALLLGFLLFIALKRKQTAYKIISKQKDEIEQNNNLLHAQKVEIQTKNEVLVTQAAMLTELDEMKSRFFSNISHELKTPLTLIISPLMQIFETNSFEKSTIEVMLRNAKKLLKMIEELLQITRMEKGAADLTLEKSNINNIIISVATSFENIISNNRLLLETEGLENECLLYFDSAQMGTVCSNLLSNAIKFTPNGKRIKITTSSDCDHFTLIVSDEGIGIPENETQKIFTRFYRASNAQKITGTGIGLSLVNDIVTLHGGTIRAEISEFNGAKFIVKIPLNKDSYDEFEDIEEKIDINISENKKPIKTKLSSLKTLLIVEDNQDLRKFLISSLIDTYNVLEAENGLIGLQIATNQNVDIIISDVMMPDMDGYSMTKAIRSNSEICHISIILLTAKSSEESIIKGMEHEADAYITKPFNLTYLKAVIANQLKIRQKLQNKFQKEISCTPSEITTTSIDEQFVVKASKIVEENMNNELFGVDDFCNLLLMSRTSVHRKITAITGLSTSDFIRTLRLKRAAQLVKGNTASISEISFMVGFSDVSYFTKCFKKQFGHTPREHQMH